MYLGLSYLINQGTISNELVLRYLTGHPVSEVTIGMFFVGMASLALIAKNIFEQFGAEKKITFRADSNQANDSSDLIDVTENDGNVGDKANVFVDRLQELPQWMQEHYLWQRLVNALSSIDRTNSTSDVEDELKYLSDLDLERQQQRYSLVRILIWATPMLGFLGTVLGISQALGGINVGPDNDFQQMMDGLRGSLYVAFDTTALALTLSIVLMFGQFLIERFESQLLVLVDQRAKSEIAFQFDMTVPESPTYDNITEEIIDASRESSNRQTEIWRESIHAAEKAWVSTLTQVNTQVQSGLADALDENVSNLAHYLGEAIERADNAMSHRWAQWQVTLSDNARLMESHQKQLCEQTDLVHQLIKDRNDQQNGSARDDQHGPIDAADGQPETSVVQPDGGLDGSPTVGDLENGNTSMATEGGDCETSSELSETERPQTTPSSEVTFSQASHESKQPATIRFEDYQRQSTESSASHPAGTGDAEVILPYRSAIQRTVRRDSANHHSKKSA